MPKHFIPKADTRLDWDNQPGNARARVEAVIHHLDTSIAWDITIERHRKTRTLSQNALYWKWVHIIAEETGNSDDDIHEALKKKFLEPREVLGEEVWSTKGLPTTVMSNYMEKCEAWAGSMLAISLPHPEDVQDYRR